MGDGEKKSLRAALRALVEMTGSTILESRPVIFPFV
jgi:hypothetical protein